MASQHHQLSYTEESERRRYKVVRHRRFHPYPRNAANLVGAIPCVRLPQLLMYGFRNSLHQLKNEDQGYKAVLEKTPPTVGLANFPVQGVVAFRVAGQELVGERRVEGCLGGILRFVLHLP